MMFESGVAIGGQSGPDMFLAGATLEEAVEEAHSYYPRHTRLYFEGDIFTVQRDSGVEFYPNASSMVKASVMASGLPVIDFDEVLSMSLEEAHQRLHPYFRRKILSGPHKGKWNQAHNTPRLMSRRFITKNAKLEKGLKGVGVPPGLSKGPNLLPHHMVASLSRKKRLSQVGLPDDSINLCVGSNSACRKTCLVYSGRNPLADKLVPTKLSRTESLLREPVAWVRMYLDSISLHREECIRKGIDCYVRPNVLSDIPWEVIAPEVFHLFPDVSFYDYTKVFGREPGASNYDLTFSFSGTNALQCQREMDRGIRVAAVFWLQNKEDKLTDLTFMGQPVIDGDEHDFRPLDPPASVIGLKFKVPNNRRIPTKDERKFVMPTFRDTETGALLVAGTPDQLGASEVFQGEKATEVG